MEHIAIYIRRLLVQLVARLWKKSALLTIVCYHGIGDTHDPCMVTRETFETQIAYFSERYEFITIKTATDWLEGRVSLTKPSMVLSFDDGLRSVLSVHDTLTKYNITPVLFVLSDPKNADKKEIGYSAEFLTQEEIVQLHQSGWDIGSHSSSHASFRNLTKKQLRLETYGAKKKLEQLVSHEVPYYAYPKGVVHNKAVYALRDAGFSYAFTTDDAVPQEVHSLYRIPRVCIDTPNATEGIALVLPSVIRLRKLLATFPILRYIRYASSKI